MSSPESAKRSNSSAVKVLGFVAFSLIVSGPPYRDQSHFCPPERVDRKPNFSVPLGNQGKPKFFGIPSRYTKPMGIIPERLGLFKINPVLFCIRVALGRVVFELHRLGF